MMPTLFFFFKFTLRYVRPSDVSAEWEIVKVYRAYLAGGRLVCLFGFGVTFLEP